jgi:Isocitrate lyase family
MRECSATHLSVCPLRAPPQELGKMGFKFQFVTLAGFHALNHSMFELAHGYAKRGMAAYSELQQKEFAAEAIGYTATKCVRPWLSLRRLLPFCSGVSCQTEGTHAWIDSRKTNVVCLSVYAFP